MEEALGALISRPRFTDLRMNSDLIRIKECETLRVPYVPRDRMLSGTVWSWSRHLFRGFPVELQLPNVSTRSPKPIREKRRTQRTGFVHDL